MACPPNIQLPYSTNVVGLSIIDTTARLSLPSFTFVEEQIKGHDMFDVADYSFLIDHPSGTKLLFDLGLRTDPEHLAPVIWDPIEEQLGQGLGSMTVEKDVATILQEGGVDLSEINEIIWR